MHVIGRNLLTQIESHLHTTFHENSYLSFGGKSIILVNDLGQLPPIMDKICI